MSWSSHSTQNSNKEKVGPKGHLVHVNYRKQEVSLHSANTQESSPIDLFLKLGCHPTSVHQKGLRVSCTSSRALAFLILLHFVFTEYANKNAA